jgi:hypothetical protein
MKQTIILTFKGGDFYNKKKQVDSILLKENGALWKEIDLDSLEESISPENKTIILRENSNLIEFERIIENKNRVTVGIKTLRPRTIFRGSPASLLQFLRYAKLYVRFHSG